MRDLKWDRQSCTLRMLQGSGSSEWWEYRGPAESANTSRSRSAPEPPTQPGACQGVETDLGIRLRLEKRLLPSPLMGKRNRKEHRAPLPPRGRDDSSLTALPDKTYGGECGTDKEKRQDRNGGSFPALGKVSV
ncbi:L-amino-acid oxidase-like [Platysternon megacephalum]|uniref:L-amino-acid oxidase-like n=1 Tax=Platysternon megacephalum TaxID=55544 RepID=A0A4D9DQ81_9SAUR|nr:L-amino-acid oxidase-like [Platysternon megacephalum]